MDPIGIIAILAMLAVAIKKILDRIRDEIGTRPDGEYRLDGIWVQVVAVIIGFAVAWFFDLAATAALLESTGAPAGRELPIFADYLVTGAIMALFGSWLHDRAGMTQIGELTIESDISVDD